MSDNVSHSGNHVDRNEMTRIAIIGAGLAGLVVARRLSGHHEVAVFEKSRGVGGRMATRRASPFEFDHGAQFFTARSAAFRKFLEPLISAGVVASWNARFVELPAGPASGDRQWADDYPHYVGVPGMNAVGKWLARNLDVQTGVEVANINRGGRRWRLTDTHGTDLGDFDWVVLAAPAPQTARLAPAESDISERAMTARMRACCALLLGFDAPLDLPWDAA
ncbi:MAG: FAD-dependent oxidoreductase, partial [Woeseiaceae bacterium]